MTAAMECRTCGAEPREGARFCDACGSPIAPATEHAEFKQVTVLFADVVRSMDIAAVLDVERFREIMTELVVRSSAPRLRWRIMLLARVSLRWLSKKRPTGWPSR